ncbi:MAG: hypothetical protein K0R39_3647, partial [Symbiobacteriaceae bacterium]|nr:hypothetical protein [Symbiobacteriaceae bacterium]
MNIGIGAGFGKILSIFCPSGGVENFPNLWPARGAAGPGAAGPGAAGPGAAGPGAAGPGAAG